MGGYSSTLFPSPLPVLAGDQDRVRALRRTPLDRAVRLRGGHRREARRRLPSRTGATADGGATARWLRERPGLVPSALFHIIGNTVFLRLSDVGIGACRTTTSRSWCPRWTRKRTRRATPRGRPYNKVFEELRKELAKALKSGSRRLLATYLQTLLAYPDGLPPGERRSSTPGRATSSSRCRPCPGRSLYPKEKALVDLVAAERLAGRRVLVYVTHTGTRDITGADGGDAGPARLPGGRDEGRRRCPGQAGGVGGGQGEEGAGRDGLPPPGWCRPAWTSSTFRPSAGTRPITRYTS